MNKTKSTETVSKAQLQALVDRISVLVDKAPEKAAFILKEWLQGAQTNKSQSSKKKAA